MMPAKTRQGAPLRTLWLVVPSVYLALAVAANLYTWLVGRSGAEQSEFAGLTLILLGLPWSLLFAHFNPPFMSDTYANSMIVEDLFIALNLLVLVCCSRVVTYFIGKRSM